MSNKEQALSDIAALAKEHGLSLDDIATVLRPQEIEINKKSWFTLARLFSILGGIFIFSGIATFIGLNWGSLNSYARVLITFGPGIVCLIVGVAQALQNKPERNVTILIVLAAIFESGGLYVLIDEFLTPHSDSLTSTFILTTLAVQYGLVFSKIKHTSVLFFTIYFSLAALTTFCVYLNIPNDAVEFFGSLILLMISYGIQRTRHNSICGMGYFLGSITFLWVGFDVLHNSMFEILYLGIAAFILFISTIVRSRSMMAASIIALYSFLTYLTDKWFVDSLGWPICLILLGFLFFGMGGLAVRLNRVIKSV